MGLLYFEQDYVWPEFDVILKFLVILNGIGNPEFIFHFFVAFFFLHCSVNKYRTPLSKRTGFYLQGNLLSAVKVEECDEEELKGVEE